MIKVALTGNIASGKSIASDYLKSLGFKVFDADMVSSCIVKNNLEVLRLFNTNNQKEFAKKVFDEPEKLKALETIVHPIIKDELLKFFDDNKNEQVVFADIPLLFEAKFDTFFDKIIFIQTDDEIRLKRLMKRNSYDKQYALKRINAQMPQMDKISKSDFVLNNDKTIEILLEQVDKTIKALGLHE